MSKKKKKDNWWFLLVALLLITIVTYVATGGNLPSGGDGDDWIPGRNCSWVVIDETQNYIVPSASTVRWEENLPKGQFRLRWVFTNTMDVTVGEESNPQYYDSSKNGVYTFDVTVSGKKYIFEADNEWRSSVTADIYLEQWVCEGDPRNFNPDMFGRPVYTEEDGNDDDCYDACIRKGYMDGYTLSDGEQRCATGYSSEVYLAIICCCSKTIDKNVF